MIDLLVRYCPIQYRCYFMLLLLLKMLYILFLILTLLIINLQMLMLLLTELVESCNLVLHLNLFWNCKSLDLSWFPREGFVSKWHWSCMWQRDTNYHWLCRWWSYLDICADTYVQPWKKVDDRWGGLYKEE